MDLADIRQILDMMREHDVAELELERDGVKLRLRKHGSPLAAAVPTVPHVAYAAQPPAPAAPPPPAPAPDVAVLTPAEDVDFAIVKSPIVGTFYRAAEPGAAAFVEPGQRITKGQPLCIIEAMKLMNEITADCDGEVVNVYVENGQAVQYGERLFAIRPA